MNAEVIKAMNRKETKISKFRKWWRKNDYKVYRVILFPIWIASLLGAKFTKWLNSRQAWSDERAKEILDYYIPRRANWDAEEQEFYFFDNGFGWSLNSAKRYLKRKDRRFWRVNCTWGGKMRSYLINDFELEGFTKEVGNCWDGWTEVSFTMIEK
jgi:hypothetical protein